MKITNIKEYKVMCEKEFCCYYCGDIDIKPCSQRENICERCKKRIREEEVSRMSNPPEAKEIYDETEYTEKIEANDERQKYGKW